MLPAGCLLRIRPGVDAAPRIERYWDYDFREPEAAASEGEYEEELAWLFRQAVERQLVSDVEVGAYLSGGIDSGSITAVAARLLSRRSRASRSASTCLRRPRGSNNSSTSA